MSASDDSGGTTTLTSDPSSAPSAFVTTHWSVVLTAGSSDTTRSHAALERLCRTYWHPVYHFVRRRGSSPADAQDLTQGFFAHVLERGALSKADPERGRFRSFLLATLKHFLADEWDKLRAKKRGAGQVLSVDFQTEEKRLPTMSLDELTPDKAYDRRWAVSLLDQVYRRLEEEYRVSGRAGQFAALRVTLTSPRGTSPYAELARRTGMTEGAVKSAVHRLRQRYRELLRATIAETVSTPEEVEEEFRYLFQVLVA